LPVVMKMDAAMRAFHNGFCQAGCAQEHTPHSEVKEPSWRDNPQPARAPQRVPVTKRYTLLLRLREVGGRRESKVALETSPAENHTT
jgi:hypothetical protein